MDFYFSACHTQKLKVVCLSVKVKISHSKYCTAFILLAFDFIYFDSLKLTTQRYLDCLCLKHCHTLDFSNLDPLLSITFTKKAEILRMRLVLATIPSVHSVHPNVLVNYKKALAEKGQRSGPSAARGLKETSTHWFLTRTFPWRRAPPPSHLQCPCNTAGCYGNRMDVISLHM